MIGRFICGTAGQKKPGPVKQSIYLGLTKKNKSTSRKKKKEEEEEKVKCYSSIASN